MDSPSLMNTSGGAFSCPTISILETIQIVQDASKGWVLLVVER
nr:MAG TPA: hypothetical protein [Caudoviricetes sp.]